MMGRGNLDELERWRERVTQLRAALEALRPLPDGTLRALDTWYDVELTYTSNALEGNTLTRSETAIVLEKGITVSGKPLKDHLEATGHKHALEFMRALAQTADPVREMDPQLAPIGDAGAQPGRGRTV